MKNKYTISKSISNYDNYKFDSINLFDIDFSTQDQISFLNKKGYEILCLSYEKKRPETDEFFSSNIQENTLVAIKPGDKIKFNKSLNFFPQELCIVFEEEIYKRQKEKILKL